ncbi:MAG TPA: BlaI/MecI/CopY family transcriptional regulator [Thermoanaerobaculia bacterium]
MPKKSPRPRLSRLELELMDLLWARGEASVREIHEAIPEKSRPAYTTIQTMLHRLEAKGAVRKSRKIGNAFLFVPEVSRDSTYRRLVNELIDVVGGGAAVVSHLVDSGKLSLEDLRAFEDQLAAKEKETG